MEGICKVNKNIENIKSSVSIGLMEKAIELKNEYNDIISLAGGEPDYSTPKIIVEKAKNELDKGNTHYAVGKGLLELRTKIKQKLYYENAIDVNVDEVIVTPGAKMAIYLAVCSVIEPGDEVLIPTPSWVSYCEIVRAVGGVPVQVALNYNNNYLIDDKILERYITDKTKMIIICSPNNPTGKVMSYSEWCAVEKVCIQNDLTLVSDEIYEKIIYDGQKNISPASISSLKDRTITVNGFSKAYAMTGWRIGYLVACKKYIDVIYKLFSHTITGVSPFIQEAAITALDCEEDVQRMLYGYEKRRNMFMDGLNKIPGISVMAPQGAFYAWVKFETLNEENIATHLLEKVHIVGVPGMAYGDGNEQFMRFSFANNEEELAEAIKRIESFMKMYI